MSKKRKTRKEKLTAGARHDYSSVFTISLPKQNIETPKTEMVQKQFSTPISYGHVGIDVRSTFAISAVLVALDIIIYFILKNRILSIPGIGF